MAKKAEKILVNPTFCKGCHICVSICPHGVLEVSETVDNRGFFLPKVINLDACKVCKLCELQCPDFAISVSVSDE
jgi:2-oxoglutarate ferredoxin oxidoreductase subunit delta